MPPVDLYLISEKSIWKNQVQRIRFLVHFKLDLYCLCSLQKSIGDMGQPDTLVPLAVVVVSRIMCQMRR